MFNKEPDNQNPSAGGQTSIIAQGCTVEGKVKLTGTLRVDGVLKGEIGTPESLVVGKTGAVYGNSKVKNAIIGGKIIGNITAENKIELQSGSHVEGDIKTKRLVINEGVFFEGQCSMGSKKSTDQPVAAAANQGHKPADTLKK